MSSSRAIPRRSARARGSVSLAGFTPSNHIDVGVAPKVVSHRVVLAAWEAAMRSGVAASQLRSETRAFYATVRATRERVDWDPYIDLIDQLREIAGSPEELANMFSGHRDALPELARITRLFVNPLQIYRFLVSTFASAGFSHIRSSLEITGTHRVRVRTTLPPAYRDGTSFFESCVGGLRAMPAYLGLAESEVEARISSHEGIYDLKLPASRTLVARLAPSVRAMLDELTFYAEEIRDMTRAVTGGVARPSFERAASRFELTPRQREVAQLITRGASNKEISVRLGCAERTVELHVTLLLRKTGATNRTQLASILLSVL
jgi:DNA-binding CsgD family transcriptional regulator